MSFSRNLLGLAVVGLTLAACEDQPTASRSPDETFRAPSFVHAGGSAQDRIGIAVHQFNDATWGSKAADSIKNAGAAWIRVDIEWDTIQPGSSTDWLTETFLPTLQTAQSRGLRVLASLAYSPRWANGERSDRHAPTDTMAWDAFVDRMVRDYSPYVDAWGIWNEPTSEDFFIGTDDEYDRLVRIAARVLERRGFANSSDELLVAPELPYGGGQALGTEEAQQVYLRARLAANPSIDVVSVHMYGTGQSMIDGMVRLRNNVDAYQSSVGRSNRWPIWLTEVNYGLPGDQNDPIRGQTVWDIYRGMFETNKWDKTFWFHLIDHAGTPSNASFGALSEVAGILTPRNTYKVLRLVGRACDDDFLQSNMSGNCTQIARLYRGGSNPDHMFSDNPNEGVGTHGFVQEDTDYFRVSKEKLGTDFKGLYRCSEPVNGWHMMTTDAGTNSCEGLSGWVKDNNNQPYGFIAPTNIPDTETKALRRLRHPSNGDRLVTVETSEYNLLVSGGWIDEGILGYVWIGN